MILAAQTTVLAFMLSGIAVNLIGNLMMVCWRKSGVTFGNLFWAGSKAAAHPETYVKRNRVKIVKVLYFTGISLFLTGAMVLLVWELVLSP